MTLSLHSTIPVYLSPIHPQSYIKISKPANLINHWLPSSSPFHATVFAMDHMAFAILIALLGVSITVRVAGIFALCI